MTDQEYLQLNEKVSKAAAIREHIKKIRNAIEVNRQLPSGHLDMVIGYLKAYILFDGVYDRETVNRFRSFLAEMQEARIKALEIEYEEL